MWLKFEPRTEPSRTMRYLSPVLAVVLMLAFGLFLFKALGKVEAEHASIWRKVLRLSASPSGNDACHSANVKNLNESHERETRAIAFYRQAAEESDHERLKQIFKALVEIETDHLHLSEERLA